MGRMKRARARGFAKKKLGSNRVEDEVPDDMEDDIDKFHNKREMIPLEDTDSEDEEFENPVLDLKVANSESGEEQEESDEDLDDEELDGIAAKIAKQAKILRQKTGIIDDEDFEDEDVEKEKTDWGKRKRSYYAADNIDYEIQSSDEEGPTLEEAEARRLQQKMAENLRPEDFEQDEEDDSAKSEDEADTLEKLVEQRDQVAKQKQETKKIETAKDNEGIPIEKVKKDFDALSKNEKMQVVMSNAPELVGLLTELREALHELEYKVQPLLTKVERGNFASKEGRSYLEMKHMLLLSYCQSIVFYLLLKAEGRSVCDHPVIARLVEIRLLLEKVRPIDKNVQKQIDKLMLLDVDKLRDVDNASVQEDTKKSKPINGLKSKKIQASDLATFEAGEHKEMEDVLGEESKKMLREMDRLEEKAKQQHLPEHIQLLEQHKNLKRSGKRFASMLDDLEDDVADLKDENQPETHPKRISQVIAEAGKRQKKRKIISGDVDLPVKEDIGERRRKHEMQKPIQHETFREQADDEAVEMSTEQDPFEDEFYQEAKQLKLAKEAAKAVKYSREPVVPTAIDESHEGKRHITYEMEKNRGLTPYRKKASKNPRKKYKMKHGKAIIRRKGQVRDIRSQTGPYGGEATGIRTNLSRSIRFND